jgi:hypothetical protein
LSRYVLTSLKVYLPLSSMQKKYIHSRLLRGVVGTIVLSCTLSVSPASSHAATLDASLRHTPSPYECAVMSAHVYLENLKEKEGDPVVVYDGQSGITHTLQGWTIGEVFQEFPTKKMKQPQHGYKGVLYVNSTKQQMVLHTVAPSSI